MKRRLLAAIMTATLAWLPNSARTVHAIYCFPGDPPDVYNACLAYNNGIGQQVTNQQQLQNIQSQINDQQAQITAIYQLIKALNDQIAAQKALIAQTQARIDELDRQIRFGEANLTSLRAHMSVREQLLSQRLRYVDAHGSVNYVELVLTALNFNELMNRMIGAQQIAASDQRLLTDLRQERGVVSQVGADLTLQHGQVVSLLQQQKAAEADLEKNQATQQAALAVANQLEAQLQSQYQLLEQQRAAIDAQVALLQQQYDAIAAKYGGGTGQFSWPMPACGHGCISQGFGCNSYWFEQYWDGCPYPHRIHTGIDIAGNYGTQIIAADTGVIYLTPGYYGYGNYIMIIHGNGYSTLYGHLASFAGGIQSGQIVPRGTVIGFEGSTGNSTGPHLHFEIRVNNQWKDPCIWLGC